jgi:hypothetical protein
MRVLPIHFRIEIIVGSQTELFGLGVRITHARFKTSVRKQIGELFSLGAVVTHIHFDITVNIVVSY